MRGRRTWIKSVDGSKTYAVRSLKINGDTCQASFDPETGDQEVVVGAPESMYRRKFHEDIHKSVTDMSSEEKIRIFGTDDDEIVAKREEELCLFLDKTLFELLYRNSHLKYPKPPSFK